MSRTGGFAAAAGPPSTAPTSFTEEASNRICAVGDEEDAAYLIPSGGTELIYARPFTLEFHFNLVNLNDIR